MSWMTEWYRTMREHNTGECNKATCRHCAREKETKERTDKAVEKAKSIYAELKSTNIAKAVASYNGGSDEGFVDYFNYYDKDKKKVDTDKWSAAMEEIAWGILGHGFGTGDYSISGDIVLNVWEGKLYNNSELIASLE